MALAFRDGDASHVIDLACLYSNHELGEDEEDSLDEINTKRRRGSEEENDGEEEGNRTDRRNHTHAHGQNERHTHQQPLLEDGDEDFPDETDEDQFEIYVDADDDDDAGMFDDEEEHDEDEEDDDEDEDDDDEEEDDEDDEENEEDDDEEDEHGTDLKTRVDFVIKSSQANIDNGKSNILIRLSYTTCARHVWDPVLYEDDGHGEEKRIGSKGDDPDYYTMFERTGTGDAYSHNKQSNSFESMLDNTVFWGPNSGKPKKAIRKDRESFILEDQCECSICTTVHGFRVEVNWQEVYRLTNALNPVLEGCQVVPTVLHLLEAKVTDPSDELFPFVRAVRILSFFLVFCGGSSGYATSPVDMLLGTLISTGIPTFSGWRVNEFFDAYESDESLGVD
jgi:hypothetical protein